MTRMRGEILLIAVVLLLVAVSLNAAAQPTYSSTHFDVYDKAGAGAAYAQSVASALESAYSSLDNSGSSLAPSCSGPRYNVTIVSLSGEGGEVRTSFIYDSSSGAIKSACVSYILIAPGLSDSTLRHVAFHEMVHVSQASYYRYVSVVQSYPWYVEASAEGISSSLSGVCGWEPSYFSYSLYSASPYGYSDGSSQCYAYGAFYYWLISSGTASVPGALSGSLSGSSANSDWVNSNYVSYLIALAKGVSVCGRTYYPGYQAVTLSSGSWSAQVTLSGLSASYYKFSLPGSGVVIISVSGNARSNLLLNQPFHVSNSSLILALANPSTSSSTFQVSVRFSPSLLARVTGGVYNPLTGTISLQLYVTYADQPITGTVTVNGVSVQASDGQATVTLSNVSWGTLHLAISYSGESTSLDVALSKPSISLATRTPLYLTSSGYGSIVLAVTNPNQVSIETLASASPPLSGGTPILIFQEQRRKVSIPPGSSSVWFSFAVNGTVSPGESYIYLHTGVSERLSASFRIEPATISITNATYYAPQDKTVARLTIRPVSVTQCVEVKGISGTVPVNLSTYVVGTVTVSVPPPAVSLQASPEVVAPSWFTANVRVTSTSGGSCPSFPVEYRLEFLVNGTSIGSALYKCGESVVVASRLNCSRGSGDIYTLVVNSNPAWGARVRVTPPQIQVSLRSWTVMDNGSVVEVGISVRGPHRYYVLGRLVSNESFTLASQLKPGENVLAVDTGFERGEVRMPPIILKLHVPEVVQPPSQVNYSVEISTNARVKAGVTVRLNGTIIGRALFDPASNLTRFQLGVLPEKPGTYILRAEAWFASCETSFLYVTVSGVKVSAERFRAVGAGTSVTVHLFVHPRASVSVNVTVRGCGFDESRKVPANTTLNFAPGKPCALVVKAQALNHTSQTVVVWDYLSSLDPLGVLAGMLLERWFPESGVPLSYVELVLENELLVYACVIAAAILIWMRRRKGRSPG